MIVQDNPQIILKTVRKCPSSAKTEEGHFYVCTGS
nr:MAG TPA: hypothetical protein [Caudoviricetes sp.]